MKHQYEAVLAILNYAQAAELEELNDEARAYFIDLIVRTAANLLGKELE